MLERSREELAAIRQGNYPPIKTAAMESFGDYDIVFVGYPIWHGSMATPMQTFLHSHASKLAGKRIALFATSGSSGISTSVNEARSLCSDATIINPALLLTSSSLSQMATRVPAWLEEIGANRKDAGTPEGTSLNVKISVGDRHGISPAQVVLAWAIAKGTTPIIGVTKPAQVQDALGAIKVILTDDEMKVLEDTAENTGVDTRGSWEMPMI